MAKIGLVLDCADPEALGSFWAAALGYDNVGRFGAYVVLLPPEPGPPKLLLQAVPEEKAGKNRMHIDLDAADIEVESRRLEALGARRQDAEVRTEFGTNWIQMADPEGNEFCVCDHGAGG